MAAETVGPRRRAGSGGRAAPAPPAVIPADALAPVVAALAGRPVSAGGLVERAVGLGLLRYPPPGGLPTLSTQAASRLLLAGYRLPAFADRGSPAELRAHLAACREVFVLIDPDGARPGDGGRMWQLHHLPGEEAADGRALTAPPGAPLAAVRGTPVAHFLREWEAAGRLVVVAARRWADLPASGPVFFGGHRWPDASLRWHAAECDTDAGGNILRV